ncbi:hypothetical protein ACFSO7_16045 [Bacillus sp. CGMCC 1.16607]|uniref:hypothetical protein n=1 Tax=Bacillus sp. CGMCC 1.16607 TaxID=3351842 RepID=UPI003642AA49
MKTALIHILLNMLFYPSPEITITKEEEKIFNDLFESSCEKADKLINYNLSVPKYKFLHYLTCHKPIVLHGSNNKQIDSFEPRKQTLFNGKMATAVFATKDPIWSIFYATLDKKKIIGDIRNGSFSAKSKKMFHFYSLTKPTLLNDPWIYGMVYLLPEDSFSRVGNHAIRFNEWISTTAVKPIVKIEIKTSDFYFRNKVASHRSNESIIRSWLFYKLRTLNK